MDLATFYNYAAPRKSDDPMTKAESQRVVQLVRRLVPPGQSLRDCLRRPSKAHALPAAIQAKTQPIEHDEVVERIETAKPLTQPQIAYAQTILLKQLRPAFFVVNGGYDAVEHAAWARLNDATVKARLISAIPSVGRIENQGEFVGTAFCVGHNLIMTNRHVAENFVLGVGASQAIGFTPEAAPVVDFNGELATPSEPHSAVSLNRAILIHPYFDIALIETDDLPDGIEPLKIASNPADAAIGTQVALVGYPAYNPAEDMDDQRDVFGDQLGVKRLQPGIINVDGSIKSYAKSVASHGHDISTLTGNSGSAMISLDTGKVIGVHFYGKVRNSNWAVRVADLACDPRVIACGVNFDGAGGSQSGPWDSWWSKSDTLSRPVGGFAGPESTKPKPKPKPKQRVLEFTLPLTVTYSPDTDTVKVRLGAISQKPKR
ncbi:trypsin-like serine peptidase [Mesorhizobium sp. A623]